MKKIRLEEYKLYNVYYNMFNSYIKNNGIKKQALFDRLNISFTSYVRCSQKETKTTKEIYLKLCKEFDFKPLDLKRNMEIEEKLNEIYYSIYYKVNRDYKNDVEWLNSIIEERYTLYPILLLFKTFIYINITPPNKLLNKYTSLFEEVKSYKAFYLKEIYEIYLLVELGFIRDTKAFNKVYDNELINQMLASLYYLNDEYNTALVYALKAETDFINNKNHIRAIMTDLTIIACYNSCEEYKKAFSLAVKCHLGLKGLDKLSEDLDFVDFHYVIACIGLGKYKEALKFLNNKTKYNINDCFSYVIIHKKLNIDLNWNILITKMNKYKNNEDIINRLKDFNFNSNVDIKYLEDIGVSKKLIKFI